MEAGRDTSERGKAKRGGGGKLSRSETVTVRLDPRLNYLCELAARAQRRTKSSFIEWAIENALAAVGIPGERKSAAGELWTIQERNADLWDVDEPDRFIALVALAPSLLTHDEQMVWKVISTSPFLWRGSWEEDGNEEVWSWNPNKPFNIAVDRLRDNWESIKRVAEGLEPRTENFALKTKLVRGKSAGAGGPFDSEFDDDCPF
jgi:predicted transcriptional regulator